MKTYKFKTNINCGGCIKAVTPFLNKESDIVKWEVDTTTSDKILTVEANNLSENEIAEIVKKAGFQAIK